MIYFLGSGSLKSLDRIAPQAIKNNFNSYFFTISNTIKDFNYVLKLFDGNKDMIKIIKSFQKPYIMEQTKLGHNALISHRLKTESQLIYCSNQGINFSAAAIASFVIILPDIILANSFLISSESNSFTKLSGKPSLVISLLTFQCLCALEAT